MNALIEVYYFFVLATFSENKEANFDRMVHIHKH